MQKPFLKWVGGKTQILDEVLRLFPTQIQNYHEPFLGGGSVLLGLLSQKTTIQVSGKIYASDINPALIGLYTNIQTRVDDVIREVKTILKEFQSCKGTVVNRKPVSLEEAMTSPESYYYWIRKQYNLIPPGQKGSLLSSAMFLFLNKTCFRGVYREGPNGFNVPFGHYKNPSIIDDDHLKEVSTLIKDVIFTVQPFTKSFQRITTGDFVYIDPPYAPEQDTSFVSYTADGFGIETHTALFKLCKELPPQVNLLMSNANVKLVKDSFPIPAYITRIIPCRRAIHSKKPESTTTEVLITNIHTSS
jgi:DNA adenine methylase